MKPLKRKLKIIAWVNLGVMCSVIVSAIILNTIQQPEGISQVAMGLLAVGTVGALVAVIVGIICDTESASQPQYLLPSLFPSIPPLLVPSIIPTLPLFLGEIQAKQKTLEGEEEKSLCGEC